MKQKKKRKLNNKGFTLVEMLVSFALIGIFMVSASQIIMTSMNIYYQAKGVSFGRQVSGIVTSKIVGEIEGAKVGSATMDSEGVIDEKTLVIKDSGSVIDLYDHTGSHVEISKTSDDYLNIYYYPVKSDNNGLSEDRYQEVNWTFDKKTYMGYSIKSMKFSQASKESTDYADNIIKLELTIHSPKYGDFSSTEYIECYNFITESDMNHISVE